LSNQDPAKDLAGPLNARCFVLVSLFKASPVATNRQEQSQEDSTDHDKEK